jgi:undecaprenyl-diphosphatase
MGDLNVLQTIILSIVEGLTEFLPVSSTGHLIIVQNLMGIESTPFVKAFTVIIQFGAILSVVVLYWKRFFKLNHSPAPEGATSLQKFLHKWDFYWKLLIAFLPAAVIGLLGNKIIDELLGSIKVVATMLVVGGIFMLFCDKIFNKGKENVKMTKTRALKIGFFQCIAMIPGVSRSMATIVGGMQQRMTRKSAAEFSFFLAVPTMFAATAWDLLKLFREGGTTILATNMFSLMLGCLVSFVVAMFAIKGFISFLTKYGFQAFGVYRIIVGGAIIIWILTGHNMVIGA